LSHDKPQPSGSIRATTLVAIAALAAFGAQAQSAVTISGIVNYGMQNSVAKTTGFNGLKGDRNNLTFGVVEDLGGGSNVTATLQMRFNMENGSAGYANTAKSNADGAGATQFEQTAIGFNSPMVSVRAGRFTNAMGVADVHVFEDSKLGTNAARAAYGRLSNTLQITSPSFSGLQAALITANGASNTWGNPGGATGAGFITGVDYAKQSFSNSNGALGTKDFTTLVLNYTNGPLFVQYADISGLAYEKATKLSGTYNFGVVKAYVSQYNQKDDIKLSAAATPPTYGGVEAPIGTGLAAHKSTEYGVSAPLGNFTLRAGLQVNNKDLDPLKSDGTTKVKKTTIGGEYALSKRTMLMYQRSNVTNGVAASNQALGGSGFGDSTGTAYWTGIQHSF
jgi:hypothetical protein